MTYIGAHLLIGLLVGLALGAVFYMGLWTTIGRASRARRPWVWFAGSFMLRLALVGLGLLLLAKNGPWLLAGAFAGLLVAKPLVTRAVLGRKERAG